MSTITNEIDDTAITGQSSAEINDFSEFAKLFSLSQNNGTVSGPVTTPSIPKPDGTADQGYAGEDDRQFINPA